MKRIKITDEVFTEAVRESFSVAGVLKRLELNVTGGNYSNFHKRVKQLCLDTSHFTGQGHLKGKTHNWTKSIPLEEVLTEESYYNRFHLKRRLLNKGLLNYACAKCGISEWNGKRLSLQLEHINGVNNDHRLENLCLLCPNCHSQTDTYAGKNIGRWATYIERKDKSKISFTT
jgi:hypothetical protein